MKEEMEEYREMRAEEKQKEADEILALKRKRVRHEHAQIHWGGQGVRTPPEKSQKYRVL